MANKTIGARAELLLDENDEFFGIILRAKSKKAQEALEKISNSKTAGLAYCEDTVVRAHSMQSSGAGITEYWIGVKKPEVI